MNLIGVNVEVQAPPRFDMDRSSGAIFVAYGGPRTIVAAHIQARAYAGAARPFPYSNPGAGRCWLVNHNSEGLGIVGVRLNVTQHDKVLLRRRRRGGRRWGRGGLKIDRKAGKSTGKMVAATAANAATAFTRSGPGSRGRSSMSAFGHHSITLRTVTDLGGNVTFNRPPITLAALGCGLTMSGLS